MFRAQASCNGTAKQLSISSADSAAALTPVDDAHLQGPSIYSLLCMYFNHQSTYIAKFLKKTQPNTPYWALDFMG